MDSILAFSTAIRYRYTPEFDVDREEIRGEILLLSYVMHASTFDFILAHAIPQVCDDSLDKTEWKQMTQTYPKPSKEVVPKPSQFPQR